MRDLDAAAAAFRTLGFRVKQGRLHANGLLNHHIKFRDGTEIELMTVRGPPGDAMARDYTALLRDGAGGAYVALKLPTLDAAQRAAEASGQTFRRSASGPWRFLSFPAASPAGAVFFTSGAAAVRDAADIFAHDPPVSGLAEVWLQGGAELGRLLARLGAASCGAARAADGTVGERWALSRGHIVVVPLGGQARPRLLGAVLSGPASRAVQEQPVPGFWLSR